MIVASNLHGAGLWRRGLALLIDLIEVQVILPLVTATAFPLSAGRVIDASSVLTSCETVTTQPTGVTQRASCRRNHRPSVWTGSSWSW